MSKIAKPAIIVKNVNGNDNGGSGDGVYLLTRMGNTANIRSASGLCASTGSNLLG